MRLSHYWLPPVQDDFSVVYFPSITDDNKIIYVSLQVRSPTVYAKAETFFRLRHDEIRMDPECVAETSVEYIVKCGWTLGLSHDSPPLLLDVNKMAGLWTVHLLQGGHLMWYFTNTRN